jgi:hypothetical protein
MTGAIGEPLLLGFSSGLACLAACGPVLLPWLAAAGAGWGGGPAPGAGTPARLAGFLAGRLAGYLVFAVVAWALGLALPLAGGPAIVLAAIVDVALGAMLGVYAVRPARPAARCGPAARWRPRGLGPVALGLFTGLNLCPPFVAATVRAAQAHSLPAALGFFALFFAGTLVWFLPFLGIGAVRRFTAVPAVARFTVGVVAVYYGGRGIVTLTGVLLHAWHTRS